MNWSEMGLQHTTARLNSAILGSGDGSNCCGDRWFAIEGKVPTAKSDFPQWPGESWVRAPSTTVAFCSRADKLKTSVRISGGGEHQRRSPNREQGSGGDNSLNTIGVGMAGTKMAVHTRSK
ncbi:hypothetical protein OROHE_004782 [Orobanche hederae]